jgi:hypothetical protein
MAYPQNARVPIQSRYWIQGVNSALFPTDLPDSQFHWGENLVNRAGIVQTRPGRNLLFRLPGKRAQGLCIYRPFRQKEQLVWSIDGLVYSSIYPFKTYFQVPNVKFYGDSPQVYFCQARQAAKRNLDGSLTVLPDPVDMLLMQDGYTASAFYIAASSTRATQAGHNKAGPPFYQCPVGTIMASSGSRLWVVYGNLVYASDLLNPNSFTEGTYLAEADGFALPEECTGMLEMRSQPGSTITTQLLVFTPFTVTVLQSGILDRTQWQNTPNFQQIVVPDYGSVSPFGIVNQFGLPWAYSEVGVIRLDQAFQTYQSSLMAPRDLEMLRSKDNLSPDRSGIAAVAFENWLLMAVPSGSRWNRHTWVMDGSPQSFGQSDVPPCWSGIWTGTYPVQFATGEIQDVPRCFELSYSCNPDQNGNHIFIWEDFMGRRTDRIAPATETPISVSWETKIFEVSQVGELLRFKFAEIDVVELVGDVSLQVYYAPIRAHYRLLYELLISAEEGLPGSDEYPLWTYQGITTDTTFESFRPQTRTIRTEEITGTASEEDSCSDTCGIESNYQHSVDKGFQLLINWQGRMGIRELRIFVESYPQPGTGTCTPSEENEINIVTSIGCLPPPKVCKIPVP